jgi:TRAP-type C4-dicarboxylate transport system substrate-binding protein
MLTSLFTELGASPSSVNFAELYTALQTKIVDGEENPLNVMQMGRLYEVQKYIGLTSHVSDGFWMLMSRRAMASIPPELKQQIAEEFDKAALKQRAVLQAMDIRLRTEFAARNLKLIDPDRGSFQAKLAQSKYYPYWRGQVGDDIWGKLEGVVGKLS